MKVSEKKSTDHPGFEPETFSLTYFLFVSYLPQENFNHKIFECLNPTGEIAAGTTANVEWVFSPLEAKTYMVGIGFL